MNLSQHIPHQTDFAHPGPARCEAADGRSSARSAPAHSALWVLGPLAMAVPVTLVLVLAGATSDWVGAAWLVAVLWTVAASFVQALSQGLRQGDWSSFAGYELPSDDENFDWDLKSGRYAYLRIQARNEELMREGDRFLEHRHHVYPRT
ncbi:MAG: hypothetical protein OXQ29_01730 [Rhodospirillaceae bacterium]|nr:hypothetical protein [Rhodospirillaceae bacterium]